ncbi:hypothetical protein [Psychrobacillus lasiicapitis]|uniref:Uncharacterized protein n=1 Tax=Psychrobacillus lasiicapitis TaxID=1636719 RepID=A0A544TI16_9BACI|nr:hypothetical protein [Psychrobacillus lasiicapitis]TQR17097.1 hypothetical protein FG382_02830 [Psychrobacillus lasiicapitis]GGA24536.1 hypothetical protein GCM10011384_12120 [Psychrobacillus lasiicapitis]
MKTKTIICILIPLLLVGLVIVNRDFVSQSIEWKLNWGFDVPRPSKMETVFTSRNGFPNEGETFLILSYRSLENKLKDKDGWTAINEKSHDRVLTLLQSFQKNVTDINNTQNCESLFQEYPVSYNENDKYFYHLEEDNSYILAISNKREQKLYVMEWIQ